MEDRNILHLDVKLANLFLTKNGHVKIGGLDSVRVLTANFLNQNQTDQENDSWDTIADKSTS